MDIQLKKKPWYIRHRHALTGGLLLAALMGYAIVLALGPDRIRISRNNLQIARADTGRFMEYADVEGVTQPIMTLMVNAHEAGNVLRLAAGEGSMMRRGDTILLLENPDLTREIEDLHDEWERQLITFREKEIEMERQSLTLRQQALQAEYELQDMERTFALEQEEYAMGIKSHAQLQVSEAQYHYRLATARLQRRSLSQDSAANAIRCELLLAERERTHKKYLRSLQRLQNLAVLAPTDGQLSYVRVVPGQQVSAGTCVAEVKVLDRYKVRASLSEYYIDRLSAGLPAAVSYQGHQYPLRVQKVVPEVKDRVFDVDLVFTGPLPANVRVGKSYRVQIELGQPEAAIIIPRGDFYQVTGGRWIYRLTDDGRRAVRVPMEIGRQNPRQYEVLSGLQPGDQVITDGYDLLGEAEEVLID